ncbi:MAG: hypothetical protein ABIH99_00730 [Candidatus Micrarchaeota archaeon]
MPLYDLMKCEVCKRSIQNRSEQKSVIDKKGFMRSFCMECYNNVEKRKAALGADAFE